jgi:PAS domain S-box-containing protein
MSKKTSFTIYLLTTIMVLLLTINLVTLVSSIDVCNFLKIVELILLFFSIPPFFSLINEYRKKIKSVITTSRYSNKLNEIVIKQSHNPLFYQGNVVEAAKILTKQITETIDTDRCSLWLYNGDKTSIICKQLYVKAEDKWYDNIELFRKDFESYFNHLDIDPIIVANNAEKHEATSCFTESYLRPLGIKAMLDVPIIYKGEIIGVFCVESYRVRDWNTLEVNFARIISSIYSFSYSVQEGNKLLNDIKRYEKELSNRMDAINKSNAVIEFDVEGKIMYANKIFLNLMGYTEKEIKGKKHSIFVDELYKDSKEYKDFWNTLKNGKFISSECVRIKKNGEPIWLQSTYNPIKDIEGNTYKIMKIATDITELVEKSNEIETKNTYLEHAAKILRHDMHSGINTYIPRGISSLERRLTPEQMEDLKITAPFKMIKEGLVHTQKVYKGVYEFTNLVKKDTYLNVTTCNLKNILESYLVSTSYKSQVVIHNLIDIEVNEPLFCTAIDNLIRNGLKYNDSNTKVVVIQMENDLLTIQDNGRGLTQEEFLHLSKPYTRKEGQKESGSGLGLNISVAILKEHGFSLTCEKNHIGTKMIININKKK